MRLDLVDWPVLHAYVCGSGSHKELDGAICSVKIDKALCWARLRYLYAIIILDD